MDRNKLFMYLIYRSISKIILGKSKWPSVGWWQFRQAKNTTMKEKKMDNLNIYQNLKPLLCKRQSRIGKPKSEKKKCPKYISDKD